MRKPDERTLKMMENFMQLRREGYSIQEISKMYGLSWSTVYGRLEEIARMNGVTREDLLDQPISADHSGRNFAPVKKIEATDLINKIEAVIREVEEVMEQINLTIEQLKEGDENE